MPLWLKRTALLIPALLIIFGFWPEISRAQLSPMDPASIEMAAQEPPLTQADIDAFIKVIPRMNDLSRSKVTAAELGRSAGLSEVRLALTIMKVVQADALISGATPEQVNAAFGVKSMPAPYRPSKAEIDLVRRNIGKINTARGTSR